MKKTILFATLLSLLAACGDGDKAKSTTDSATTAKPSEPDMSGNPDYQKGLALVGGSDCFTCHKIEDKLTGPAYQEVANKYAANTSDTVVTYLAHKIIKGGTGVWGEAVMTPHPAVSEADAEAMAKYVLLLKK